MAGKKKPTPPMNEEDLRKLGDLAIEKYGGKISTTLIQRCGQLGILTHNFYNLYIRPSKESDSTETSMKMDALTQKIRELEPKYCNVKYEKMDGGSEARMKLKPEEKKIFEDMILHSSLNEGHLWRTDNPPIELIKSIQLALSVQGYNRSLPSVAAHARCQWQNRILSNLPAHANRPRPKVQAEEQDEEESIIAANLEVKLNNFKKAKKDNSLDEIMNNEHNEQKKSQYLLLANRGHQALVAYLMDEKNYKKLLGNDYELVAVDFTKANTPCDLYDKFRNRAERLAKIREQYGDLVSFVDDWLRCDMIFKDGEGKYHVAEIKQNAVNHNINGRKGYPNADKVVEQISAYIGGLKGKIEWKNINKPEENKIPDEVHGIVIAYVIAPELYNFLMEKDELRPVRVSKREVGRYIREAELLHDNELEQNHVEKIA